ncbi:MAG TPA: hypothetical protein VI759_08770 [Dehalococcoidia bacterium]|nr:hypothetical protein [Dehalococcoidia bacterium]
MGEKPTAEDEATERAHEPAHTQQQRHQSMTAMNMQREAALPETSEPQATSVKSSKSNSSE